MCIENVYKRHTYFADPFLSQFELLFQFLGHVVAGHQFVKPTIKYALETGDMASNFP